MHAAPHFIKYNSIMLAVSIFLRSSPLWRHCKCQAGQWTSQRDAHNNKSERPARAKCHIKCIWPLAFFALSLSARAELTLAAAPECIAPERRIRMKMHPQCKTEPLARISPGREMIFTADLKARVRHFAITLSAIHEVGSDPCRVQSLYIRCCLLFVSSFIMDGPLF